MVNIRMAYKDATKLPELVPPITSIFILLSSNAFNTPACAIPLIPPPDKAIPNFKIPPSFLLLLFTNFYDYKQKKLQYL